jgi:hypothetical protein
MGATLMATRNMVSRTFYMEPTQWEKVDQIARDTRLPRSLIMREGVQRAIDYYTEDGRTRLGRAEGLALDILRDGTDPSARKIAKALLRLADDMRNLRQERDAALVKADSCYANLLKLQRQLQEMLGHS